MQYTLHDPVPERERITVERGPADVYRNYLNG